MTTMAESLVCWKCGASIEEQPLPLSRTAECVQCLADLYVCKMCKFYDTSKAKSCQETIAEEVRDKERANFCDYLTLKPHAFSNTGNRGQEQARQQLEAMFEAAENAEENTEEKDKDKTDSDTEQGVSKDPHVQALEDLFKK